MSYPEAQILIQMAWFHLWVNFFDEFLVGHELKLLSHKGHAHHNERLMSNMTKNMKKVHTNLVIYAKLFHKLFADD